MTTEYDKTVFQTADLYDIRLKQCEEYRKDYENERENNCDGEDFDELETPEEYSARIMDGLSRGEEIVLMKYNGDAEDVTVPDCITMINAYSFRGKTALRSVTLPNTVKQMGRNAFDGCSALEQVWLDDSLSAINAETFRNCTALESITLPDSVESVRMNAFDGCIALKNVRLGEGLKFIGWDAFARCTALKTVRLPESLEEIDLNVFYDSGLEEIYLPKNLKSLNSSAFIGCVELKKLEVDPENPYFYSRDNCVYNRKNKWLTVGRNDGTLPDDGSFTYIDGDAFVDNPLVKELTVPSGVTSIGISAFNGCVNLRRVTLPDTLSSIGRCAFEGCTALEEIVIPGSVKKIDGLAFWKSGVKKVVVKRGVEIIGDNAFGKCDRLRELYIPSTVKQMWSHFYSAAAASVRVYIETSAEKNYERWLDSVEKCDVVLGFDPSIFD
ncbi:MAG: leucine-rich repeat domain-containing protein [Roseburia sp.]|nr:leucine-rich repeat domain-containing protein [Roseburia sp.]